MTSTLADAGTATTLPLPVRLGSVVVDPAVVLAPMAGITNAAFRRLCREQAGGRGIFVCEMITSRGLVERDPKTAAMLVFDPSEATRSVQLYGVDPGIVAQAVTILCAEYGVAHVDLNFGCPVPKVTRKGGGAALPYKRRLFASILDAAVRAAQPYDVPVTVKTRIGIDDDHQTYLAAGRSAVEAGCAAIALHARTAAQHYSGQAHWRAIAKLKAAVPEIPVLGNGDIWEAADALRMVEQTGCDGVVVGRGCLGRPWLFRDLVAAFTGRDAPPLPTLAEVAVMIRRHAELLSELVGEDRGVRDMRKHMAWYTKGFVVGQPIRAALGQVASLADLDALLRDLDGSQSYPAGEIGMPRGRTTRQHCVRLPDGWLDDPDAMVGDLGVADSDEDLALSGG